MEGDMYLISESFEPDEIGQLVPTEKKSEPIPCRIEYISQKEFFQAGQNGLKAELKIVTQACNYNNEEIVEYEGNRYGIYRPYRRNDSDEIELYCERKGGIDEQSED